MTTVKQLKPQGPYSYDVNPDDFYGLTESAVILKTSRTGLYRLVDAGLLSAPRPIFPGGVKKFHTGQELLACRRAITEQVA